MLFLLLVYFGTGGPPTFSQEGWWGVHMGCLSTRGSNNYCLQWAISKMPQLCDVRGPPPHLHHQHHRKSLPNRRHFEWRFYRWGRNEDWLWHKRRSLGTIWYVA